MMHKDVLNLKMNMKLKVPQMPREVEVWVK